MKIKTVNNKMAKKKKIYQQLNLKNKLSKQKEQRAVDTESVLIVARWQGGVEGGRVLFKKKIIPISGI